MQSFLSIRSALPEGILRPVSRSNQSASCRQSRIHAAIQRAAGRLDTERGLLAFCRCSAMSFRFFTSKTYCVMTLEAPPGGVLSMLLDEGLPVSSTWWSTWPLSCLLEPTRWCLVPSAVHKPVLAIIVLQTAVQHCHADRNAGSFALIRRRVTLLRLQPGGRKQEQQSKHQSFAHGRILWRR